jgi:hypothetical protein
MLDTHMAAVIAMTIFCPFQMAMLTMPMSDQSPREDGHIASNTEQDVLAENDQK